MTPAPIPLPNVLYIGMGKSGSTMLYKVLQRHPDICTSPSLKELNFFGKNERWTGSWRRWGGM